MAAVIPLKEIRLTNAQLSTEPVIQYIHDCYAKLAAIPGFIVRDAQVGLSIDVCRALMANEPLLAEAPTGTGKTLAYLIGALAASTVLTDDEKGAAVVIATATVGLQSQILEGDYPLLVKAGIAPANSAIIAKGRGRYYCIAKAEQYLAQHTPVPQYDIFDLDANDTVDNHSDIQDMQMMWTWGQWQGDVDLWPKGKVKGWSEVAATSETCIGYKCEHYDKCPFFKNRRGLGFAKVIIANQDLVLADLQLMKEEADPVFPSRQYLVVFDEAHHLPEKAIDVGAQTIHVSDTLQGITRLTNYFSMLSRYSKVVSAIEKYKYTSTDFDLGFLRASLESLARALKTLPCNEDNRYTHRFEHNELPKPIFDAVLAVMQTSTELLGVYEKVIKALKTINTDKYEELKRPIYDLLSYAAFAKGTFQKIKQATEVISGSHYIKWAKVEEDYIEITASPLEGAEVLKPLLWNQDRARPVMVSATIRDFQGFERYKQKLGIEDRSVRETVLPHIFPYQENTVQVVLTEHTPKFDTKKEFVAELKTLLPQHIQNQEATLVLFPSMAMMKELLPIIEKKFPGQILAQHTMAFKDMLRIHKQRVDEKKGSILCGVATLAEGLDLPGKYCTHVIICALPFTAPTSPVEEAIREKMGIWYFRRRSLPDMYVKLIQMLGRLMRRESDRGTITIFDRRILKPHMKKVWENIPPFKKKFINGAGTP